MLQLPTPPFANRLQAACLLALLVAAGCSKSAPAPSGPSQAELEAQEGTTAAAVIDQMKKVYQENDSYFDNAEYHESFLRQGERVLIDEPMHMVSVVMQRPNQFRVARRVPEGRTKELDVVVICDGERYRATLSDFPEQMLDLDAPEKLTAETLAATPNIQTALLPVPVEGLYPQLDLLLGTDETPARLLAGAKPELMTSKKLETPYLDEPLDCYRVRLNRDAGGYILWIDKEQSLLRRLEIPTDQVRKELDPGGVMMQWRLWIDFRDATIGSAIAKKTFELEPTEDQKLVEKFEKPPAKK